ncbi:hypothetical protein ECPA25_5560, partial [Escherichia coli PA25]
MRAPVKWRGALP